MEVNPAFEKNNRLVNATGKTVLCDFAVLRGLYFEKFYQEILNLNDSGYYKHFIYSNFNFIHSKFPITYSKFKTTHSKFRNVYSNFKTLHSKPVLTHSKFKTIHSEYTFTHSIILKYMVLPFFQP